MARLAKRASPDDSDEESSLRPAATRRPNGRLRTATPDSSISPTATFSSDKENHVSSTRNARGKQRMSALGDSSTQGRTPNANKRRRVGERDNVRAASVASGEEDREEDTPRPDKASLRKALNDITDTSLYDPEQPAAERRRLRRELGDLSKNMADSKNEYLQANNDGILKTLRKANKIFNSIKQTSDATLDSRLLANVGDLSAKRSIRTKLGDTEAGVDVDEFVTKCASFMRRGPNDADAELVPFSTQHTRHRIQDDSSGEDLPNTQDTGDELNWPWLGLKCAFPANIRPPMPGFLLGPLSVQKKTRQITQRRARQERRDPADAQRPDELKADQIERQENANLTALCAKIFNLLAQYVYDQGAKCFTEAQQLEEQLGRDLTSEEEIDMLRRYHVSDDPGACLFHFAFNPKSFGQTVENLFYISFLIRDGKAGITTDRRGLMVLVPSPGSKGEDKGEEDGEQRELTEEERKEKEREEDKRKRNARKHQSVFHLDYDMWKDAVETFEIEECVIPHRVDDGGREVGEHGWYG